jgi:hypothetical protein
MITAIMIVAAISETTIAEGAGQPPPRKGAEGRPSFFHEMCAQDSLALPVNPTRLDTKTTLEPFAPEPEDAT